MIPMPPSQIRSWVAWLRLKGSRTWSPVATGGTKTEAENSAHQRAAKEGLLRYEVQALPERRIPATGRIEGAKQVKRRRLR
jgi:hypothetical protein